MLVIVLKTSFIILFALLVMLLPLSGSARADQAILVTGTPIVPDHLVFSGPSDQGWSSKWMAAREYVRNDQRAEAVKLYEEFLAIRPELIEARWEYVQLLLAMERYDDAEGNIEILLEANAKNLSYHQAQGILLLATGRPQRAVVYLARVWDNDKDRYEVGVRLYQTYMALGEKTKALPVLEDLHRKKADDVTLQQALFRLYVDMGNDQQAQALGVSLANAKEASFELILLVAQVHDRLGLTHLAAEYWQKIILLRPGYSPAHSHLAAYYKQQGREAEALPHLLHGYHQNPDDTILAGHLGALYASQNNHEQAIPFLEQYLLAYPDDADKNIVLAQSYRNTGDLNKSSRLFSHYLELVDDPAEEILLEAAQVFMETGDKKKAVSQYQKLVTRGGDSEKYLVNLARNLSATGRYDEALKRWQQLAAAKPNDIVSRQEIATLYDKLGRRQEMAAMLQEIHELDASNYLVTLRLAEHYFLQGQDKEGWQLFQPVLDMEFFSPDFLATRARIFHFLGLPEHAFKDMAEVVGKENASDKDSLTFLDIAGALGRRDVVMAQASRLVDKAVFLLPAGQLIYAKALGRVGEIGHAERLYEALLAEGDVKSRVQARLDAAEMYRSYGFFHEAEQHYRLAWLDGHDQRALFALVDFNLFLGEVRNAEDWLDAIPAHSGEYRCQRSLYELRVLNGLEKFEDALFLGRQLLSSSAVETCTLDQRREIMIQMAKAHFGEGDEDLSLPILTTLVAEKSRQFSAHVNLFQFYVEMGEDEMAKETMVRALEIAGYDAGLLTTFMEIALENHLYPLASSASRKVRDNVPDSLGFLLRFVRVLELNGELDEAYSLVNTMLLSHADNALLNFFGARIALSLGHYDRGLVMVEKAYSQQPDWHAALLVKARLQWALFQWTEAIATYGQTTMPPVQQLFLNECTEKNIALPPHEELSLWMKVIQPMGKVAPLQRSLQVDFVMAGNYEDVARQAASFYSAYKWQMIFNRELGARKSVQRREYYRAARQYESLIREEKDTTLLFDLAGVYSSLDRVGAEAMVYQQLQKSNPDFPGLNEAISRNYLKRQPQTGAYFSHLEKEGRQGYFDLRKDEYGISGWLSPMPQKEIKVSASRIYYESPTSGDGFYGKRADVYMASNLFDYLQFQSTIGGHILDGDRASVAVYDFSATGFAGDRFESYIGIKRQVVADTLASVDRTLMAHVYEGRAELDLMPRLQAGGELHRTEYSDDNDVNGYSVWFSSVLLLEPHFLKATILYEFLHAQQEHGATGALLSDGFADDDHPYWAPKNYWRNHFDINYKHKFSDDVLGRSTPSFFTAGYSFSYDVDEDTVQVFRAGFNIEINTSWILKIDTEFEESNKYQARDVFGTLLYRW